MRCNVGVAQGDQQGIVAQSPVIHQRVKTAIDNELKDKGYRLTDSAGATFFVRFAVGSKTTETQVYNDVSTGAGVVSSNSCGGASCWPHVPVVWGRA